MHIFFFVVILATSIWLELIVRHTSNYMMNALALTFSFIVFQMHAIVYTLYVILVIKHFLFLSAWNNIAKGCASEGFR